MAGYFDDYEQGSELTVKQKAIWAYIGNPYYNEAAITPAGMEIVKRIMGLLNEQSK